MINRDIGTAVITGPTGAIGTALCKNLSNHGIEAYAIVHNGSTRANRIPDLFNVHKVTCDLDGISKLPQLIGKPVDAFFHFAWAGTTGSARSNMEMQIDNIRYTLDAVHVASLLKCKVFVGAGSQAEYGRHNELLRPDTICNPETGYGAAKLCAGNMSRMECSHLGIACVWPRILSVYGPNDNANSLIPYLISKLSLHEHVSMTKGTQIWDYLYSGDAAEALWQLALHGIDQKVYPLGSGTGTPLMKYTEIVKNCIDPSATIGYGEKPFTENQVMFLQADITDLNRDTGFCPKKQFKDGIIECIKC